MDWEDDIIQSFQRNANSFRSKLQAIIQKYNQPFKDDDLVYMDGPTHPGRIRGNPDFQEYDLKKRTRGKITRKRKSEDLFHEAGKTFTTSFVQDEDIEADILIRDTAAKSQAEETYCEAEKTFIICIDDDKEQEMDVLISDTDEKSEDEESDCEAEKTFIISHAQNEDVEVDVLIRDTATKSQAEFHEKDEGSQHCLQRFSAPAGNKVFRRRIGPSIGSGRPVSSQFNAFYYKYKNIGNQASLMEDNKHLLNSTYCIPSSSRQSCASAQLSLEKNGHSSDETVYNCFDDEIDVDNEAVCSSSWGDVTFADYYPSILESVNNVIQRNCKTAAATSIVKYYRYYRQNVKHKNDISRIKYKRNPSLSRQAMLVSRPSACRTFIVSPTRSNWNSPSRRASARIIELPVLDVNDKQLADNCTSSKTVISTESVNDHFSKAVEPFQSIAALKETNLSESVVSFDACPLEHPTRSYTDDLFLSSRTSVKGKATNAALRSPYHPPVRRATDEHRTKITEPLQTAKFLDNMKSFHSLVSPKQLELKRNCLPSRFSLQRRHSLSSLPSWAQCAQKNRSSLQNEFDMLFEELVMRPLQNSPQPKIRSRFLRECEDTQMSETVNALINSPLRSVPHPYRRKREAQLDLDDTLVLAPLKRFRNVGETRSPQCKSQFNSAFRSVTLPGRRKREDQPDTDDMLCPSPVKRFKNVGERRSPHCKSECCFRDAANHFVQENGRHDSGRLTNKYLESTSIVKENSIITSPSRTVAPYCPQVLGSPAAYNCFDQKFSPKFMADKLCTVNDFLLKPVDPRSTLYVKAPYQKAVPRKFLDERVHDSSSLFDHDSEAIFLRDGNDCAGNQMVLASHESPRSLQKPPSGVSRRLSYRDK